jgi:hypothetical protein
MTLLMTCALLVAFGCFLLYCGLTRNIDPLCLIGIVVIVCTICFGFGFLGSVVPVGDPSYTRIAPTEILIGNSDIIVRFKGEEGKLSEVREDNYGIVVNAKSNNIEILRKETKNSYGIQLDPTYSVEQKKSNP